MSTRMQLCSRCERHFMTLSDRMTCHWCTHSIKQRAQRDAIRSAIRKFDFSKGLMPRAHSGD